MQSPYGLYFFSRQSPTIPYGNDIYINISEAVIFDKESANSLAI